jgi:magnesium-transporting ATPase (P-type)
VCGRTGLHGGALPEGATDVDATMGLTPAEARARLERDGPNVLPPPRRVSALQRLAAQMAHFFAVLLWIAAGMAMAAGMAELGLAIAAVVLVNGIFAFVQEHRAERAAEALSALVPRRATVLRGGEERAARAARSTKRTD